jgi:hypothetical protein
MSRTKLAALLATAAVAAPAVAALAPAAAQARTTTETRTFHGVTATFSFRGASPNYSKLHLRITRAGATLLDAPVRSRTCGTPCAPGSLSGRSGSLHVVDLEHNGTTDVLLDLFSGGVHCCWIEQIFTVTPGSATVRKTERDFGDPGAQLVDLRHNGRLEFLTADDRFAYAFTSYAASGLPLEILTYARGHYVNVTRHFRGRLRKDAADWLALYRSLGRQGWQDTVGVIAAWAADEDLLGHSAYVASYLDHEAALGHLNSADPTVPGGRRYVTALDRFLRRLGYLR